MTKNFAANLKIGGVLSSSVGRVFGGLNRKIKEQESTLKGLRAAYKDAAKGTGEYAGKLDELKKKISEAEAEMKQLRAASKFDVGGALKGIGSTFANDAKRLAVGAGILTGAVAGVGAAIYSTTSGFVDWADDIGDSAEALNMSTQALQTWQFAAATVGVGGAKMTATIAKLSKTIMDGGDNTDETLGKLSINAGRLRKLGLDEQLEVVAEAFKNYKGADRAAIAMKLFGRSGYQLAGILAKGKKGLDEFRKAGEETGAVLTDEAAKAAGDAASALDMFGITMTGLRNTIAIQFVPVLQKLTERFTTLVRENGPKIKEWATSFASLIETRVAPALGVFVDKLPGIISDLASFATKAWDITVAVKDFVGGWDKLGIAILALNFAPTIVAIGQLTRGLWLMSGASWAVAGPIGLAALGVGALFLAITAIVDPGGPLDLLGRVFPETMQKIRDALESAVNFISDKIDLVIQKIRELFEWFDKLTGLDTAGFFMGGPTSNYDPKKYMLPGAPLGGAAPSLAPAGKMPSPLASEVMLQDYLKTGGQNNTFNINVTAPGGDGRRIADQIRSEFNRKPLFDSDGALSPAR